MIPRQTPDSTQSIEYKTENKKKVKKWASQIYSLKWASKLSTVWCRTLCQVWCLWYLMLFLPAEWAMLTSITLRLTKWILSIPWCSRRCSFNSKRLSYKAFTNKVRNKRRALGEAKEWFVRVRTCLSMEACQWLQSTASLIMWSLIATALTYCNNCRCSNTSSSNSNNSSKPPVYWPWVLPNRITLTSPMLQSL